MVPMLEPYDDEPGAASTRDSSGIPVEEEEIIILQQWWSIDRWLPCRTTELVKAFQMLDRVRFLRFRVGC